jgi:hypothetical protein
MGKYSDWYAVELEGYLRGRLPDIQRFEAVKEVSNHFAEHVDDLVEKGMDPIEAEKAAIKAFGSPRKSAINFLTNTQSSRLGAFFRSFSMLGIVLFIFAMTCNLYCSSMHFQLPGIDILFKVFFGFAVVVFVSIILSTLLQRRVAIKKLLLAWTIGLALTTLGCLVVGKPQYAGVPDREMPHLIKQWKAKNAVAFKLSEIDQRIRNNNDRGRVSNPTNDQTLLLAIKTDAPKLLEGRGFGFVEVVGKETNGYLVPIKFMGRNNMGYRYGLESIEDKSVFPTMLYQLKYEKDPKKAVAAWRENEYPYFSSYESGMATMAVHQLNFIAGAEQLPAMGLFELTFKSVGMVALMSGSLLAFTLICSWILLQLSSVTFQSSFRRRIA